MGNLEALHRWIDGTQFQEMLALEFEGRILFPDSLKRKNAKGEVVEVAIMLRVPRQDERAKARVDARKWAAKLGLDPDRDADHVESLDTVCLLARAIRDPKEPYPQHMLPHDLVAAYDTRTLLDAWDRVNACDDLIDPRPAEIDDATYEKLVHALRRSGSARPLIGLASSAQNAFVLRMASDLSSFLTARSSSSSPERSTSDS